MARSGILYSQVAAAASQLAEAGSVPTIDSVRAALGGTGSKSTIGPMLKRWKEAHQESVPSESTGLPAAIVDAVKIVYQLLQDAATDQVQAAVEQHREEMASVHRRLDEMLESERRLQRAHEALTAEHSRTLATLAECQKQLQISAMALTAAQATNEGLQQRLNDRTTECRSLRAEITQLHEQHANYEDVVAHERAAARREFDTRIAGFEKQLADRQESYEKQQTTITQQQALLAQSSVELSRVRDVLADKEEALSQMTLERDRHKDECQELATLGKEANRRADDMQAALIEAKGSAVAAEKHIQLLEAKLVSAAQAAEREKNALIDKLLAKTASKGEEANQKGPRK